MKRIWKCYVHPFYQLYVHLWKQWRILPTRRGTRTLPPRSAGFPGWESARTLDRTERYIWIPTTFTRFNTPGLLPLGDLEGCCVSQETGYAGGTFVQKLEQLCAAIPINTLTEVAQSTARRCNRCLAANGNHFEHPVQVKETCTVLYCNVFSTCDV